MAASLWFLRWCSDLPTVIFLAKGVFPASGSCLCEIHPVARDWFTESTSGFQSRALRPAPVPCMTSFANLWLMTNGCLASTTGERIFDQIVDVIEGDFVDARENFKSPRWLVLEKNHDRSFDGVASVFYTGNLFDHNRRVGRKR